MRASEQDRPDVSAARRRWRTRQPRLDLARLVFLDESGFVTNMTRRYGRAPRGQRLVCPLPRGHWKATTLIAGVRQEGMTAPMVLDGPIDTEAFHFYLAQVLVPTLRPGDIVILDNLPSHKHQHAARLVAQAGATLRFLPPYSPDLNPFEQVFAKLKAFVRAAAPRSVETLWTCIGQALTTVTPQQCHNFLIHAGYGSS